MNKYLHIFLRRINFVLIIFLLLSTCIKAQLDMGAPGIAGKAGATTLLRNYEAIGVNPANLGWDDNNRISLGIGYVNINVQSRAFDFNELLSSITGSGKKSSTDDLLNKYTKIITTKDGLNLTSNINWAGISLHFKKLGGISFSMRDRFISHISAGVTSQALIDSLVKGGSNAPPISKVFSSTNVLIEHLREINFAYGFKIKNKIENLDLYGGIGYKYLLGLGYINVTSDRNNAIVKTTVNSDNDNKYFDNAFPIKAPMNIFNADGHGSAIDIGANAVYFKRFKFGVSLTDIGEIKWNSVQEGKATMIKVDTLQKKLKSFSDLFAQEGLFNYMPSFNTSLPAKCRLGAGIKVSRFLEVGADIVCPLNKTNGYKDKTFLSVGGEVSLFNYLKLNTGISGNNNIGWNVPLGITLSADRFYDIYIATNDILTYFNKTKNPMFSFAICAFRFNLPPKKIKNKEIKPVAGSSL